MKIGLPSKIKYMANMQSPPDQSDNPNDHSNPKSENTQVDLGEDLLTTKDTTREMGEEELFELGSRMGSPDEMLASARILFNEGILEEAKKILFKLVRIEPRNILARKLLDEIHQQELRVLFSDVEERKPRFRSSGPQEIEDTETVIAKLEKEIGIEPVNFADFIFTDPRQIEAYWHSLKAHLSDMELDDRLDLGVAFMEMGWLDIAERIFFEVARLATESELKSTELKSKSLQVFALSQLGRDFESIMVIETILNRSDFSDPEKIEFHYQLARIYERTQRPKNAVEVYRHILQVDRRYRDSLERFQKCGGRIGQTQP